MHWEIHPPRPSRFPSGGDSLGPRDCPRAISRASGCKIPALVKSLGHRGMYFPIHPSSQQCTDTIIIPISIVSISIQKIWSKLSIVCYACVSSYLDAGCHDAAKVLYPHFFSTHASQHFIHAWHLMTITVKTLGFDFSKFADV